MKVTPHSCRAAVPLLLLALAGCGTLNAPPKIDLGSPTYARPVATTTVAPMATTARTSSTIKSLRRDFFFGVAGTGFDGADMGMSKGKGYDREQLDDQRLVSG